jgi:hypothetical protein
MNGGTEENQFAQLGSDGSKERVTENDLSVAIHAWNGKNCIYDPIQETKSQ